MHSKDLKILFQLRQDARMSLTKMSRKTGIPVSTIFDRIKSNDYIVKHTTLIDFDKLGYFTRVNIFFKVDRLSRDIMTEFLIKHPSINTVFRLSNDYDFLVEGVFKKVPEINDFLEDLENRFQIEKKDCYFIAKDLKREAFLTNELFLS